MKRKIGRPSDYRPEYCDKIIECGLEGMHVYQMCKEFMCSTQTLYTWAETHPEFFDAFTCARDFSKAVMLERSQELFADKNAQPKLIEMNMRFMTDYVRINGFIAQKDPIKRMELLIEAVDRGERSPETAEKMAAVIERSISAKERVELEPLLKRLEASIEASK